MTQTPPEEPQYQPPQEVTAPEDHVREPVEDDVGNVLQEDPSYRDYVETQPPEGAQPPGNEPAEDAAQQAEQFGLVQEPDADGRA